jgi:hypothetical protein
MSALPDHDRQTFRRLKLNTQFPYLLNALPDQTDWRPDGCIWIAILALCMSASGQESTPSGRLHQSSLIWTWKENLKLIDHWTSSGRATEMSRRMQVGIEASRYSEESGKKFTSSGRMMLGLSGVRTVWHVVRTAGIVDRWASGLDDTSSGQLAGNGLFWLAESFETLLNSVVPVKQHLYIQVILSK